MPVKKNQLITHINRQTNRHTKKLLIAHINKQRNKQTKKKKNQLIISYKFINRQTNRQTKKQLITHINRQTNRQTVSVTSISGQSYWHTGSREGGRAGHLHTAIGSF